MEDNHPMSTKKQSKDMRKEQNNNEIKEITLETQTEDVPSSSPKMVSTLQIESSVQLNKGVVK